MKELSPVAKSVYNKREYLAEKIPQLELEISEIESDLLIVKSKHSFNALNTKLENMKRTLFGLKIEWNKFYK